MQAKLEFCQKNNIRYNGALVYRSMLQAALNCNERLDDRAVKTLRLIERKCGASKCDLISSFNTLNRILQVCAKEVEKPLNAHIRRVGSLRSSIDVGTPGLSGTPYFAGGEVESQP